MAFALYVPSPEASLRDLAGVVMCVNFHVVPHAKGSLLGDAVQRNGDALPTAVHLPIP